MAKSETTEAPVYSVRAVDRVCDILDTLANVPEGASLSQIAEAANLAKSSAFRYLSALEARHYVQRTDDNNVYQLGLAFRPQHTRAVERLAQLGRPGLSQLRDELEETINLGVLDGAFVVHAAVVESPHMMRLAAREGERGYIHSTALGKAICAQLPTGRVRSILNTVGTPRFTPTTITDTERYLAELEQVREVGYGLDDTENQSSGRCVGVVLEGLDFPAGISLSAPADRFPAERAEQISGRLHELAKDLARQMLDRPGL